MVSLDLLTQEITACNLCPLSEGRTQAVPGVGDPQASLMIVGEGPGEAEDRQGLPFVGRSGQLLTETLVRVGLSREDVYITNVVKCRPPNNRDPLPSEVSTCQRYLEKQVDLIRPNLIVALGRIAAAHLLGRTIKITKEHGRLEPLPFNDEVLVSIVYHPSYVLRNRNTKIEEEFYQDLLEAKGIAYGHVAAHLVHEGGLG